MNEEPKTRCFICCSYSREEFSEMLEKMDAANQEWPSRLYPQIINGRVYVYWVLRNPFLALEEWRSYINRPDIAAMRRAAGVATRDAKKS